MQLCIISLFAQSPNLNGSGTDGAPYEISNVSDLISFASWINNNNTTSAYYKLTNDIEITQSDNFVTIGTSENPFTGTLDGDNHTISGISLSNSGDPSSSNSGFGFISYVSGPVTIKNLILSGDITNNVGKSNGEKTGVGGFVGKITSGTLNIIDCVNSVNVTNQATGNSGGGGFVGNIPAGCIVNITRCFNTATISSSKTSMSAIVGRMAGTCTINYFYNLGNVTGNSRATAAVAWRDGSGQVYIYNGYNVGTLTGQVYFSNAGTFKNLYSVKTNIGNSTTITDANAKTIDFVYQLNISNYDSDNKNTNSSPIWKVGESYPVLSGDGKSPIKKVTIYSKGSISDTQYLEENDILNLQSGKSYYTDQEMTIPFENSSANIPIGESTIYSFDYSLDVSVSVNNSQLTASVKFDGQDVPLNATTVSSNGKDFNISYQWRDDSGVNIAGATTATLSIADSHVSYSIRVVVTSSENPQEEIVSTISNYDFRRVIYVKYNGGDDSNSGLSPEDPVQTMACAYGKLSENLDVDENIVVLMDSYNDNTGFLYTSTQESYNENAEIFNKPATITGKYNDISYGAQILFAGDSESNNKYMGVFLFAATKFEYLKFKGNSGYSYLYCQGHDVEMGEEITLSNYSLQSATFSHGTVNMGESLPQFCIFGGFLNYDASTDEAMYDSNDTCHITVKSGKWLRVLGGGRGNGNHGVFGTADKPFTVAIKIEGNTKINLLCGGQTDGACYIESKICVNNGTIGRLLGASIGNLSRTSADAPKNTYFGKTEIEINGGTIQELFGGSLGRSLGDVYFYGSIKVNIKGGTISNNVYACGAGGVTGYKANCGHSDEEKGDSYTADGGKYKRSVFLEKFGISNQKIEVNISGGNINGNVYGGGYGFCDYLIMSNNTAIPFTTIEDYLDAVYSNQSFYFVAAKDAGATYCDSYINISGGTIDGNVFGGGRGSDIYVKLATELSNRNNNINSSLEDLEAKYKSIAQIYGDTHITISGGTINGSVFGGSEGVPDDALFVDMAKVNGNTNLTISNDNATINSDVFGGGNAAIVTEKTHVNVTGGTINGNIFGGGNKGDVIEGTEVVIGSNANP